MMDKIKEAKDKNKDSIEKGSSVSPRQLQEEIVCPLRLNFDQA